MDHLTDFPIRFTSEESQSDEPLNFLWKCGNDGPGFDHELLMDQMFDPGNWLGFRMLFRRVIQRTLLTKNVSLLRSISSFQICQLTQNNLAKIGEEALAFFRSHPTERSDDLQAHVLH
jgi:hypothetical protein